MCVHSRSTHATASLAAVFPTEPEIATTNGRRVSTMSWLVASASVPADVPGSRCALSHRERPLLPLVRQLVDECHVAVEVHLRRPHLSVGLVAAQPKRIPIGAVGEQAIQVDVQLARRRVDESAARLLEQRGDPSRAARDTGVFWLNASMITSGAPCPLLTAVGEIPT